MQRKSGGTYNVQIISKGRYSQKLQSLQKEMRDTLIRLDYCEPEINFNKYWAAVQDFTCAIAKSNNIQM